MRAPLLRCAVASLLFPLSILTAQAELQLQVQDAEGNVAPNTVVLVPGYENAAPVERVIIDQRNLQFQPQVIVAPLGEPVYFPNSDKTRHQVYSFSSPNNFELKLYRQQDAPPVAFDAEGVVELGCNIHDSMKGYIFVTRLSSYGVSNAQGQLTLPLVPAWPLTLHVWHPLMGTSPPRIITLSSPTVIRLPVTIDTQPEVQPSSLRDRLQRFKKSDD